MAKRQTSVSLPKEVTEVIAAKDSGDLPALFLALVNLFIAAPVMLHPKGPDGTVDKTAPKQPVKLFKVITTLPRDVMIPTGNREPWTLNEMFRQITGENPTQVQNALIAEGKLKFQYDKGRPTVWLPNPDFKPTSKRTDRLGF